MKKTLLAIAFTLLMPIAIAQVATNTSTAPVADETFGGFTLGQTFPAHERCGANPSTRLCTGMISPMWNHQRQDKGSWLAVDVVLPNGEHGRVITHDLTVEGIRLFFDQAPATGPNGFETMVATISARMHRRAAISVPPDAPNVHVWTSITGDIVVLGKTPDGHLEIDAGTALLQSTASQKDDHLEFSPQDAVRHPDGL